MLSYVGQKDCGQRYALPQGRGSHGTSGNERVQYFQNGQQGSGGGKEGTA